MKKMVFVLFSVMALVMTPVMVNAQPTPPSPPPPPPPIAGLGGLGAGSLVTGAVVAVAVVGTLVVITVAEEGNPAEEITTGTTTVTN